MARLRALTHARPPSVRETGRRTVAALVAALLALLTVGGLGASAVAVVPDNTLNVSVRAPGQSFDGLPVFESNQTYTLDLGYGRMADGHTAVLTFPADSVSIPDEALVVRPETPLCPRSNARRTARSW